MIDAVIAWVDGSDPVLTEKRQRFSHGTKVESFKDVAGATRFASNGEIHWCVRSIELFAPWVRKIYIVTDGQDPHVKTGRIPVEIVDHSVIFRGYEKYLPTFNSLTIETMIWRIPGLSERFLYFNDDFILINPVKEEDFFLPDGTPIVYGYHHLGWTARLARVWEKAKRPSNPKVMFRDTMLNAAALLNSKTFYRLQHVPHGMRRDVLEKYFFDNPEVLERNIRHRFRHIEQFNPQELQYLICKAEVRDHRPVLVYVEPRHPDIVEKPGAKFFCVNSLDSFDPDGQEEIKKYMNRILY